MVALAQLLIFWPIEHPVFACPRPKPPRQKPPLQGKRVAGTIVATSVLVRQD